MTPGTLVYDLVQSFDDMGVIEDTPLAQPWVNWFCHERCRGRWLGSLTVPTHILSGEPLTRTQFFDIETVEREEYESRVVL